MVQQFLEILPRQVPQWVSMTLLVAVGVGALLWVAGARFGRFLTTLLTVGLGAALGMHLPGWFGWNIHGAGPAVGAAVVLGVTGFVLHGMWAGILLGLVLALWATFITWVCARGADPLAWPALTDETTLVSFLTELWNSLPKTMQRMTPFWAAAGLVSGVACSILWTRVTSRLAWSAAGVTMLVGSGLASIRFVRPQWLERGLPQTWVQAAVIVAAVLVGVLVQSTFTRSPSRKKPEADSTSPPGAA